MSSTAVSRTALGVAVLRGLHRLRHAPPRVLDDAYAAPLVGPGWAEIEARLDRDYPDELRNQLIANMVARTRYTEDRLRAGRFPQYLVLGAGLDSVAFRGTGASRAVTIVEVDDPPTQAWKRARVAELGLRLPADHLFVPVDFETGDLHDALEAGRVDLTRPTLVSWLGVTQYLTRGAVEETLRALAAFAPGSEIVLTYQATEHLRSATGGVRAAQATAAAAVGEPFRTAFTSAEAAALVRECGLRVVEHLTHDDMRSRYFAGRADVLGPPPIARTIAAAVG